MIDFIFGGAKASASMGNQGWLSIGGSRTNSGQVVNQETAYNYSAVWCATQIIAETAASLPLIEYRSGDDGSRTRADDRPEFSLMKDSPNHEMGSMAFREGRTAHQVNWGNGFAEIVREGETVKALWPIHASRVRLDRMDRRTQRSDGTWIEEGELVYLVKDGSGQSDLLTSDEMLHIPGVLSDDGIWGRGVIPHGKQSIGFGLATEKHGAEYFSSGGLPSLVVAMDGLGDAGKRDEARREWRKVYGKQGEVAFLPRDVDVKEISIPNEAAQFLETRQFNITEIARWYNLPPHMLKELSRATFSNIEQQSIDFVIYSLLPWLRRWEEQLNLKLVPKSERGKLYFEHNVAGLLRGDMQARYTAYQIALDRGFMTINEVRRLENLNPIGPAGDQHFVQLNMTTAERMLSGEPAPGQPQGQQSSAQEMFDQWTRNALKQKQDQRDEDMAKIHNRITTIESRLLAIPEKKADVVPETPKPDASIVRPVLLDSITRLLVKESNAAQRAMSKPEDEFISWMSDFYGKHRGIVAEALEPSAQTLAAIGTIVDVKATANHWAIQSEAELSNLYNTATKEQFTAAVSAWPKERAGVIADEILSEGKRDD